jgi:hypothetical protein
MPKIRGRLQYQPLMPDDAKLIDDAIAHKVFHAIGCRCTKVPLLTLPLEYHDFKLPSGHAINGGASGISIGPRAGPSPTKLQENGTYHPSQRHLPGRIMR